MIYKEKFNEWLNSAVVAEEVKEELVDRLTDVPRSVHP